MLCTISAQPSTEGSSERFVLWKYDIDVTDAKATANVGVHPARGRTATVLQPGWYTLVRGGRTATKNLGNYLQKRGNTGHNGTD